MSRISWNRVTTYTRKQNGRARSVRVRESERLYQQQEEDKIFSLCILSQCLLSSYFFFGHEFVLIRSFFFSRLRKKSDEKWQQVVLESKSSETFTRTRSSKWKIHVNFRRDILLGRFVFACLLSLDLFLRWQDDKSEMLMERGGWRHFKWEKKGFW